MATELDNQTSFDIAYMICCAIEDRKQAIEFWNLELTSALARNDIERISTARNMVNAAKRYKSQFETLREAYSEGVLVIAMRKSVTDV